MIKYFEISGRENAIYGDEDFVKKASEVQAEDLNRKIH